MKEINSTVVQFKETIFATISRLASEKKAINLGQGFPDFDGPSWIRELAAHSFEGKNQYAPSMGVAPLRKSIADTYQSFYNLNFDPDSEITVTNGATEAIFCTALALINPGDEVILFEPFYDSYAAAIKLAGGIPVPVTLHAPEFSFRLEELERAFTSKTKLVFFNSPHNPTGKVFSEAEMKDLAKLVIKHDSYLVSDEVYEFLTFDKSNHRPISGLEGMKERTLTISSAGKTFGLTGWKIGWVCAPPHLTHALRMVHQFNTFSVCGPLQFAVASALEKIEDYVPSFRKEYAVKREILIEGLHQKGFTPLPSAGTYFVIVPTQNGLNDIDFCKFLIEEKLVASIPLSPFYLKSREGESYIRFCFAKKEETLRKALENLS